MGTRVGHIIQRRIVQMYIRTYVHTYICTYVHTHILTYVHRSIHPCIHALMHACIHTSVHIHVYNCIYIYIYTCVYIHTRPCTCSLEFYVSVKNFISICVLDYYTIHIMEVRSPTCDNIDRWKRRGGKSRRCSASWPDARWNIARGCGPKQILK